MIKLNLSDTVKATMVFNHLLDSGTIKTLIRDMDKLDTRYSNVDKNRVAEFADRYKDRFETKVVLYRPWNPISKAYATTYSGNHGLIKLNSRKINRPLDSLVGSVAHEWGHCLEYYTKERFPSAEFNHGDNSRLGKLSTFQYQLGRRVKAYVKEFRHEILSSIGLN